MNNNIHTNKKQNEQDQQSSQYPLHPCLEHKQPPFWFRIYKFIFICLSPILLPFRIICVSILILLSSFIDYLLNIGTDQSKPLPKIRQYIFQLEKKILFKLALIILGFIPIQYGKPNPKARVIIANHQSTIDIILAQAVGIQSAVSKAGVSNNFVFGNTIKVTRSILARSGQNSATQQLKERLTQNPQIYPPIGIFPEGTTVQQDTIIKFRSGTFLTKPDIQIVSFNYKTYNNIAYTAGGTLKHVLNILFNPIGIVKITYHELIHSDDNETPEQYMERCRQLMKQYNNAQIVPYTFKDCMWYNGNKNIKKEDLSQEYLNDFGWMGKWTDYKQLCKKYGKNPGFQWSKQQLHIE